MGDEHEAAAAWGVVAAGTVVEEGQALGLPPEEIAADAHAAAEEAYALYLHLLQHAQSDEEHVATMEATVGRGGRLPKPGKPHKPRNPSVGRGHAASHGGGGGGRTPHPASRPRPGGGHGFLTPHPSGGGGGHLPPVGHLPFHGGGGGGGGALPPSGHLPFPGGGGGGGLPPAPPHMLPPHHGWHGFHPHRGHGFGRGFGGGPGWGYDGPLVEEGCPLGYHPEELPDGSIVCMPDEILVPEVVVGHGGHGGGGHHGGRGRRGRGFFGGGWGGWGGYPYYDPYPIAVPVVVACGPGHLLLADGTCFDPSQYGHHVAPVTVGASVPSGDGWEQGAPCACSIAEDGTVTLPDGNTVHVEALDWSAVSNTDFSVGQSAPPTTQSSWTPGMTPSEAQQNALQLDSLWQQLNAVAMQESGDGTLNSTQMAQFQLDYENWESWYTQAKAADQASLLGDSFNGIWWNYDTVNLYTSKASAWYNTFKATDPSVASDLPALPGPAPPPVDPLAGVSSTIEWGVIAVLIGVGLWLLWPALVAGKSAMAAAL